MIPCSAISLSSYFSKTGCDRDVEIAMDPAIRKVGSHRNVAGPAIAQGRFPFS